MKTTTKLKKKRKNGFLSRMRKKSGRKIINLKRKKNKASIQKIKKLMLYLYQKEQNINKI